MNSIVSSVSEPAVVGDGDLLASQIRLLSDELDTVVDLVHEKVARLPEYAAVASDPEGRRYMREATHFLLQSYLDRLCGKYREGTHVSFVRRATLQRAESGVPAQAVLYSYQVASRVLWDWIVGHGEVANESGLAGMWSAWMRHVDRATRTVLDAYVAAASTDAISTSTIRWQFLLDFIGGAIAPEVLGHRLNEVGYGKSQSYVLVIASAWNADATSSARMAQLGTRFVQNLTSANRGAPPCLAIQGSRAVLLISQPRISLDSIRKSVLEVVQSEGDQLGVVVSREVSWTLSGELVFRELDAVSRTVLPGQSVCVGELSLIDHAASRLYTDISQICSPELRAFMVKGQREHPEWIETVNALVLHDLNVREAAKSMFVHPNTIYYRIDQMKQQLSLDPMRIQTLMDMRIAIRLVGAIVDSDQSP